MVRATASDRVHAARRAVQAWGRHDIHPMRSGGVKSFADDLVLGRGVVLSRAATSLRSIETQPLTRRFVRYGRAQSPRSRERGGERNGEREKLVDRAVARSRRTRHAHTHTHTHTHTETRRHGVTGLAPAELAGPTRPDPLRSIHDERVTYLEELGVVVVSLCRCVVVSCTTHREQRDM